MTLLIGNKLLQKNDRGMTLVEVCLALTLLMMMGGLVVTGLNNMTRAHLRQSARGLRAVIKKAYVDAALTGDTYRLTLKPGNGAVALASSQDRIVYDTNSLQAAVPPPPAASAKNRSKDRSAKTAFAVADLNADSLAAALLTGESQESGSEPPAFHDLGQFKLESGVSVLDVWLEGSEQPVTEGEIYLFFFPGGYTIATIVHLQDTSKRVKSLDIASLSGSVEVVDGYLEIPK